MSLQLVYGSQPVNGQLVPELTATQIFPDQAYVPYWAGRGAYTPTLPPPVTFNGTSADPWTSGMIADPTSAAAAAPFDAGKSPVLWALAFLVVGVIGLRIVHWRG